MLLEQLSEALKAQRARCRTLEAELSKQRSLVEYKLRRGNGPRSKASVLHRNLLCPAKTTRSSAPMFNVPLSAEDTLALGARMEKSRPFTAPFPTSSPKRIRESPASAEGTNRSVLEKNFMGKSASDTDVVPESQRRRVAGTDMKGGRNIPSKRIALSTSASAPLPVVEQEDLPKPRGKVVNDLREVHRLRIRGGTSPHTDFIVGS